jgi:superfamily II DNA or RNA helicase
MTMNLNMAPHKWQMECLNSWIINKHRGIAKVVTGAGKSLLAMMAVDYLNRISSSPIQVFVIVPTKVLQLQWQSNFIEKCGLPQSAISLYGGGGKPVSKAFIHIMIVNTAVKVMSQLLSLINENERTFLVCDECHRYGSKMNSEIFKFNYDYTMGLSATPEREGDFGFEEKIVPGLGGII